MNATASSQTGCSGWAPAPELCPYGAPAAATSPPAFVNKPQPFPSSYITSFLLNLTHTTHYEPLACLTCARSRPSCARSSGVSAAPKSSASNT